MKTNILAKAFIWLREVIEEMDSPLSLLFLVMLPIIVPITPAWITATSIMKYMDFPYQVGIIIGISVEMLGYGGLITLLSVITDWIRVRTKESLSLVFLIGAGYLIYILSLLSINVILDADAGNKWSHVLVMALLTVGLSIAAGIFNGYRISTKQRTEAEDKRRKEELEIEERKRKEENEFKLEKLRIKQQGKQPANATSFASDVHQVKVQKSDWRTLTESERREVINVLSVDEIMHKYGVGRSTAFGWKSKKI